MVSDLCSKLAEVCSQPGFCLQHHSFPFHPKPPLISSVNITTASTSALLQPAPQCFTLCCHYLSVAPEITAESIVEVSWSNSIKHLWRPLWHPCIHSSLVTFILGDCWMLLPVYWSYRLMMAYPDVLYCHHCGLVNYSIDIWIGLLSESSPSLGKDCHIKRCGKCHHIGFTGAPPG